MTALVLYRRQVTTGTTVRLAAVRALTWN